ncbi:MAG: hypothetical protein AB7V27_07520 [Candidatus Binatia bacterium]
MKTVVSRSRMAAVALGIAVLCARAPVAAQCVGDCAGDGAVTVPDLVLGVNIALGNAQVSACPAFADMDGNVTVAQLIIGVNNALNGCPTPVATATATAMATATGTPPPTATATEAATATATEAATATATDTAQPTATLSSTPGDTATATASPQATATVTATLTSTTGATATATPTNTDAPATATATGTPIDPGEAVAGRAAVVSTGLGGIQSVVGAVISMVTNQGSGGLAAGFQTALGMPSESEGQGSGVGSTFDCSVSGTISRACTQMTGTNGPVIHLVLGADECVTSGPAGGSAVFDGPDAITVDSNSSVFNSCEPLIFVAGTFNVNDLSITFRNASMQNLLRVQIPAMLGTLSITPDFFGSCLVDKLDLTLDGFLSSMSADGHGVQVSFDNTAATISDITFNEDCVPLAYTLTFNGDAAFTPIAPSGPAGLPAEERFDVTFTNFRLRQDASMDPATVEMTGSMTSSCFGGSVSLSTPELIMIPGGEICPTAGVVDVLSIAGDARVRYSPDGVTVTPEGGVPMMFSSCFAPELLMCPAIPQ